MQTKKHAKIIALIYIYVVLAFTTSFKYQPKKLHIPFIPQKSVVLTDIFSTPQLTYEQNVYTIASPYHNNVEGITNQRNIIHTSSEEKFKTLLKQHKITHIFLPYPPQQYILEDGAVFNKIITGKYLYPWLEDLSVPQKYYLYKIDRDKF